MIFWIAIALLAGGVAALIMLQAARANRANALSPTDPAAALYVRQLDELDELATRGLLNSDDHKAAFAEAARRLINLAPGPKRPVRGAPAWSVMAAVGVSGIAALALYWMSGNPGLADQPFAARMAAWRSSPPQTLSAAQMAAVLQSLSQDRPRDVQLHVFLAKAELAAGDPTEAAIAMRRAARLDPADPAIQALLGQALVAASRDETVSPEAEAAFSKAAIANPSDLSSRYFLGLAQVSRGEIVAGVAAWQALRNQLPQKDPRRSVLDFKIAEAAGAAAQSGGQSDMIAGMVSTLAARLRSEPDNPEGWARLVRSYAVLGDSAAQKQATTDARKALAARPQSLARFEVALKASR